MRNLTGLAFALLLGCGGGGKASTKPTPPPPAATPDPPVASEPEPERAKMISLTPGELTWGPLDPQAGDAGAPIAAQLWGEPGLPNGMFIKLSAGNPGLLHTHTADYHGITVAGTMTNQQDGQKKVAALPPQSYWYQPGGVAHITACGKGVDCIVYTHWPVKFDFTPAKPVKGAKPDPRYHEKRAKDLKWQPLDAKNPKSPQFAPLWGDPQSQPNGMLMKVPAGREPSWHVHTFDYHGIVLAGTVNNIESGSEAKDLPVGSYWMQPGGVKHTTNCKAGGPDCVVYVHFEGAFDIKPAE